MTSPTALPPPYVLRRWGTEVKRFPNTELEQAVSAFWDELLGSDWDPESRWYGWELAWMDKPFVSSTREQLDRRVLLALGTRWREPGFAKRLVAAHVDQIKQQRFDPAAFLALEVRLERIDAELAVLRKALGLTAPLVHVGRLGDSLDRPAGAAFTVATSASVYPNGAGTLTYSEQWRVEVYAPGRLSLVLQVTDEEGSAPNWDRTLEVPPGAESQPLVDAFLEQSLFIEARTNPHLG